LLSYTKPTAEVSAWIKNDINAYLAARDEEGWTWWIPSLVPGCTLDMSPQIILKGTVE
jgi:hypothetical protein